MAVLLTVSPYADDERNLPVANVESAIPFYRDVLGFTVVERSAEPLESAILERDGIQIGISENGGDPAQEGCFFEVDDAQAMFADLRRNGLKQNEKYRVDNHGETSYQVFFVVAPDGLCYCLGERQR